MPAMGEKEKMKQFAEIRQRDADCIVVTEGYFNKRKEESPSQQAMRAFLQENIMPQLWSRVMSRCGMSLGMWSAFVFTGAFLEN